jgi:hypothetical protein
MYANRSIMNSLSPSFAISVLPLVLSLVLAYSFIVDLVLSSSSIFTLPKF